MVSLLDFEDFYVEFTQVHSAVYIIHVLHQLVDHFFVACVWQIFQSKQLYSIFSSDCRSVILYLLKVNPTSFLSILSGLLVSLSIQEPCNISVFKDSFNEQVIS